MQAERSVELIGTNLTCGLAYSIETSPREAFPPSYRGLQFPLVPNSRLFAGDHGGAAIPVPIPNTEVKRSIAEGSAGPARARVGRCRLFLFYFTMLKGGRAEARPPWQGVLSPLRQWLP